MLFDPRQDQVSRDILAAAEIIKRGGMCKGALENLAGQHCVNGALLVAIVGEASFGRLNQNLEGSGERFYAAQKRILPLIQQTDVFWSWDIPNWNNHPETTQEMVVETLCRAAGVSAEVLA